MSTQLTPEQIVQELEERGTRRIKLGIADIDGVLRGKCLTMDKFRSLVRHSAGFRASIFGWDSDDRLLDNVAFSSWSKGFPDAPYRLSLDSIRGLPFEDNVPFFLAELVPPEGRYFHPICPRNILGRQAAAAEDMGYAAILAFEYEFSLFDETPHSVRDKHYRELKSFTPGNFGYSIVRNSVHSDVHEDFMEFCEAMDLPLDSYHAETGPGVMEAALQHADALEATDRAVLFKTFAKVFFQRVGLLPTFMAKWSMDQSGQGGHLHMSLREIGGGPAFHDPDRRGAMSELQEQFVAGQLKYMRELCAMVAPTINSYARLLEGGLAPTTASWGIDNRTCALRVIPGPADSQRVEYRLPGADGNPYLVAAAALASGLAGIREQLPLLEATVGNAHEMSPELLAERRLPTTLRDATELFRRSELARESFGDEFVDHFAATRDWEIREFERMITDWELSRYFEII